MCILELLLSKRDYLPNSTPQNDGEDFIQWFATIGAQSISSVCCYFHGFSLFFLSSRYPHSFWSNCDIFLLSYLIFIIVIMLNFKLPSSFLFLPFTYYPTYSLTHSPLFLLPTLTPPFDFVFNTAFHVLVYPFPYYSGHQGWIRPGKYLVYSWTRSYFPHIFLIGLLFGKCW